MAPYPGIRRSFVLVVLAVLFGGGVWTAPAREPADRRFQVGPVPSWVVPASVPDGGPDSAGARDGILDLLSDSQIRVTATSVERYYRHVSKALSAAGLEDVSQVQFDFDPSEERLRIHYVHIVRNGETIDALRPDDVSVFQPERELDDQLLNGQLTALAFLRDVRPGDVVDYAYSLESDEGYGGNFADEFELGESYPVRKIRWRMLWPASRPVWFRSLHTDATAVSRTLGEMTEYTWEVDDASAVDVDDDAPLWFDPTPIVQVSEFKTWRDVVKWALPYYAVPEKLSPGLTRQIEAWRAASDRPEDRLLAAARFVQDEVRYTGLELGPSSYVPADPSTVFERRYGDCKDKSLLLVTILRALGIDASPALVNLDRGRDLPNWQPSPMSFDHCVARASIDGKTYWIDSTIMLQRGDLARRRDPAYESALVVDDRTTDLATIDKTADGASTTSLREVYTLDGNGAKLEVTTVYTGADADDARLSLARLSRDELVRDGLNYYAGDFADIEADGVPTVDDDEGSDTLTLVERYTIPSFWEDGARTFVAARVDDALPSSRSTRRTGPLAIEYPADVTQTIVLHASAAVSVHEDSGAVEDDAMRFTYRYAGNDRDVTLEFHYQALRDDVPAARAAAHRQAVKKARRLLAYTIRKDEIGAARVATLAALVGAPLLGLGMLVAAFVIVRRRRLRMLVVAADPTEPEPSAAHR